MAKKVKPFLKGVTVSDKVKDYGNDPLVIRKSEQARAFIEKYGFPEELGYGSRRKTKV